jgi:Putative Flp pilus-assembly TadE/G-like
MKFSFKLLEKVKNQAGVSAVIVAIVLPMLIGFGVLAVDVGYMYVTKNELQNVADASALAGARYLGWTYEGLSRAEQQAYVFARSDIVDVVQQIAGKNQAAKMNIFINDADVLIGDWDAETGLENLRLTTTFKLPDAVRVIARRDNSANGPILTFFARIFNIATVNVVADATAALTSPTEVEEGELKTPFGVSERMFDPPNCTDVINFSPTGNSCAGWHNFFDDINANAMATKLIAFIVGDGQGVDEDDDGISDDCLLPPCGVQWLLANFGHLLPDPLPEGTLPEDQFPDGATTPKASEGDYFEFQGGDIASLFNGWYLAEDVDINGDIYAGDYTAPASIATLFDYFRRRDDDENDAVWTTTIPVYKEINDPEQDCANPRGGLEIVGFAEVQVLTINAKDVVAPKIPREVSVKINCEKYFLPVRGGGGSVGFTRGTIPNLVE